MEIKNGQTGPIGQPGQPASALPPEMAAFMGQLPPHVRHEMALLYRNGKTLGAVFPAKGSPLEVLFANSKAGAQVLKGYFEDLAKAAPTEKLAALFKQAASATEAIVDLRKMAAQMEIMAEQAKAALLMRMVLDEEMIRSKLRTIKTQDLQAALDLLKQANQEQEGMLRVRVNAEQLAVAGLVVAVTAPAAAHSKLEGAMEGHAGPRPTLNDAKADERIAAFDPLKGMQAMASQLKLGDHS